MTTRSLIKIDNILPVPVVVASVVVVSVVTRIKNNKMKR